MKTMNNYRLLNKSNSELYINNHRDVGIINHLVNLTYQISKIRYPRQILVNNKFESDTCEYKSKTQLQTILNQMKIYGKCEQCKAADDKLKYEINNLKLVRILLTMSCTITQ